MGDHVRYVDYSGVKSDESKSLRAKYLDKLFRVAEKLSDVNYKLENVESGKTLVVHFNQIKKVSVAESEGPQEAEENPRRSERARRAPSRLRDYDMDDGNPKVK